MAKSNPPNRGVPPATWQEVRWLAIVLIGSAVFGFVLGVPVLLPLAGALGYAIWLLVRMHAVIIWMRGGAHVGTAPATAGLTDAMVELVHREKKYSRKQKNRYRNALAQFNGLAAELPDATIVLDEQRNIRWANVAAHELLDIHPERDRGQKIDNLLRGPEMQEFFSNADSSTDFEIPSPREGDRTLALRLAPSPRKMTVLIARDVTQRVRVREMRKAFVGDVSHELRTPLTVIGGYLEVLGDDRDLPPPVRDAIARITGQANRMRHIVEHLLELSKLEGNPLGDGEGEEVEVGPMVLSIVEGLESDDTGHRFETDVEDGLALIGSSTDLWSACRNLAENAVRYTETGTRVRISWRRDELGRPVYAVEDDGPGIESRHLSRLSERFYRVDPGRSRERGGTGLGLAIVKHVAQRHGGQLLIESVPGQGSRFRVEFPAARAAVTPPPEDSTGSRNDDTGERTGADCHVAVTNAVDTPGT